MQILIFHPLAKEEIRTAANYYDDNRRGLGDRFLDAIEHGMIQIQSNPFGWRKFRGEVRCYLVQKFPYGILYITDDAYIFIVAIMHLHRVPDYWIERLVDMPQA